MAGAPAKFEVLLTEGAEQDLEAIHEHISEFDCVANANHVLDELMHVVDSLSKLPERGSYPKELVGLGIKPESVSLDCPAAQFWFDDLFGGKSRTDFPPDMRNGGLEAGHFGSIGAVVV